MRPVFQQSRLSIDNLSDRMKFIEQSANRLHNMDFDETMDGLRSDDLCDSAHQPKFIGDLNKFDGDLASNHRTGTRTNQDEPDYAHR